MDLQSDNGAIFGFSQSEWAFYLDLAKAYGWKPQGSRRPKNLGFFRRWDGGYDTNDGQYVLPSDAQNLAAALNRAVLSENLKKVAQEVSSNIEDSLVQMLGGPLPAGFSLPVDVDIENVIDFCAFCERGGFFIE